MSFAQLSVVDVVMLGLLLSIFLQVIFGTFRLLLVEVCDNWMSSLTCHILTLKSNSDILWYVFNNILAFHVSRTILAKHLTCGVTSFLLVNNFYFAVWLYVAVKSIGVELF